MARSYRRPWIYVGLGLWSFVALFPLYWVAITSLKGENEIDEGPFYLPFVDFAPRFDAWKFIFFDPDNLVPRFINSGVVALSSTLLTLLFAAFAIYSLTRFPRSSRWRGLGNERLLFALIATRILPPAVLVLPVYLMAQYSGMLDTRGALITAYTATNLPVALWLLRPVLGSRASEQEESALLDGASHLRIALTIVVPMARAGLAAAGMIIFVLSWNEYLFAAFLASDQAMTLPPWAVGQLSMKEAQVGGGAEEVANLSAATVLMAAFPIAVAAFARRALGRLELWGGDR